MCIRDSILGAAVGAFLYVVVIGTLKKYGATPLSLTIATLALQIIISAIINIYADYIRETTGIYTRVFLLRTADFKFMELPGVLVITTILITLLIMGFHFMLTKTKFGIAMRATVENAELASMMGINVEFVCTVSWILTGGLAGLAGSFLPLWFQGLPETGNMIMTSVFAASVLGGLSSIYGAMIGGYIIGLSEILGIVVLSDLLGPWVAAYRMLIPLTVLAVVLMIAPRGIVGVIENLQAKGYTLKLPLSLKGSRT
mgnify:CR=1 FL=1